MKSPGKSTIHFTRGTIGKKAGLSSGFFPLWRSRGIPRDTGQTRDPAELLKSRSRLNWAHEIRFPSRANPWNSRLPNPTQTSRVVSWSREIYPVISWSRGIYRRDFGIFLEILGV